MIVEQYFIENKWRKETDQNEDGTEYYYYALDIADGFSFISNSDDETFDGEWTVGFFDCSPSMKFDDEEQLDALILIARDGIELGAEEKQEFVDFCLDDITELIKGFATAHKETVEPIRKYNSGMGALLCNGCSTIMATGEEAWSGNRLYCDTCEIETKQ